MIKVERGDLNHREHGGQKHQGTMNVLSKSTSGKSRHVASSGSLST